MGILILQILLVAAIGLVFYHMVRAMGMRELAECLKLVCYGLCIANALQIIAHIVAAFSQALEAISKAIEPLTRLLRLL